MAHDWRMTIYDVQPQGRRVELPAGAQRFIYARDGCAFAGIDAGAAIEIASGDGAFASGAAQVRGEGTVWVYEVGPDRRSFPVDPRVSMVLSKRFEFDFGPPWLLRADRVESMPGSVTPRHGHRGPGMRRLVSGRLLAEVGDAYERIEAGSAWFETGLDPVIGKNIHTGNNAFVRVMVLPIELEGGKSSFMPATPEDAAKPRAVTYRLFGEAVMERDCFA